MTPKEWIFLGEEASGGGFLLKVYSGETIELNRIGVEIWKLLDKKFPRNEIPQRIAALCGQTLPTGAADDIDKFIGQLQNGNWINEHE